MELLTPKDVAKILRVSLPYTYKMADRGQLPCIRWECPGVGKKKRTLVRFDPEAVQQFVEKHRSNGRN
jgi:excisionase family DNA binding protein